ncbi:MAG: hypothetical protein ACON5A_05170 [Candidatus Comchoanobacterales bacterium]
MRENTKLSVIVLASAVLIGALAFVAIKYVAPDETLKNNVPEGMTVLRDEIQLSSQMNPFSASIQPLQNTNIEPLKEIIEHSEDIDKLFDQLGISKTDDITFAENKTTNDLDIMVTKDGIDLKFNVGMIKDSPVKVVDFDNEQYASNLDHIGYSVKVDRFIPLSTLLGMFDIPEEERTMVLLTFSAIFGNQVHIQFETGMKLADTNNKMKLVVEPTHLILNDGDIIDLSIGSKSEMYFELENNYSVNDILNMTNDEFQNVDFGKDLMLDMNYDLVVMSKKLDDLMLTQLRSLFDDVQFPNVNSALSFGFKGKLDPSIYFAAAMHNGIASGYAPSSPVVSGGIDLGFLVTDRESSDTLINGILNIASGLKNDTQTMNIEGRLAQSSGFKYLLSRIIDTMTHDDKLISSNIERMLNAKHIKHNEDDLKQAVSNVHEILTHLLYSEVATNHSEDYFKLSYVFNDYSKFVDELLTPAQLLEPSEVKPGAEPKNGFLEYTQKFLKHLSHADLMMTKVGGKNQRLVYNFDIGLNDGNLHSYIRFDHSDKAFSGLIRQMVREPELIIREEVVKSLFDAGSSLDGMERSIFNVNLNEIIHFAITENISELSYTDFLVKVLPFVRLSSEIESAAIKSFTQPNTQTGSIDNVFEYKPEFSKMSERVLTALYDKDLSDSVRVPEKIIFSENSLSSSIIVDGNEYHSLCDTDLRNDAIALYKQLRSGKFIASSLKNGYFLLKLHDHDKLPALYYITPIEMMLTMARLTGHSDINLSSVSDICDPNFVTQAESLIIGNKPLEMQMAPQLLMEQMF